MPFDKKSFLFFSDAGLRLEIQDDRGFRRNRLNKVEGNKYNLHSNHDHHNGCLTSMSNFNTLYNSDRFIIGENFNCLPITIHEMQTGDRQAPSAALV